MGWIALRNTLPCRCLLNQKPISESQLLLAAVPKAAGTKETWKELMETLAWSFTALYDGACPKKDKAGKPMELQKGKRFRKGWLWAITGDLEWYASEFSWPYSSQQLHLPILCCRSTAGRVNQALHRHEAKCSLEGDCAST